MAPHCPRDQVHTLRHGTQGLGGHLYVDLRQLPTLPPHLPALAPPRQRPLPRRPFLCKLLAILQGPAPLKEIPHIHHAVILSWAGSLCHPSKPSSSKRNSTHSSCCDFKLGWVFIAVCRLSLAAASEGYSSLRCPRF